MGLDVAIDALYATGWNPLDSAGCAYAPGSGRLYPGVERVRREFHDLGFELSLSHVQLFGCDRAAWSPLAPPGPGPGPDAALGGAVVGSSSTEAAVYALAQVRRAVIGAPATV